MESIAFLCSEVKMDTKITLCISYLQNIFVTMFVILCKKLYDGKL